MSFANRLQYYWRIFSAYLVPGRSQLTFWHETPLEIFPQGCILGKIQRLKVKERG